jgi:hypothetical protein
LSLWRAGTLQGQLQLTENAAASSTAGLPEQIHFRLLALSERPRSEVGVMLEGTCRIVDRALHECAVPAGRWHLRLFAEGFTPIYRWNVQISARRRFDLERVTLTPGASVAGRVVTEDGSADPSTLQVTIRPVGDNPWRRDEKKLVKTHAEVSRHGYFQVTGLHRGTFVLTAQQPGYVATTIQPLRVGRGEVVELKEPIVLERAVRLHVEVTPESPPDSDGWHVQLLTPSAASAAAHGRTVGGFWASDGIGRGAYRLMVTDQSMGIVAEQKIELIHDRQLERVDLDLVQVHGQVLLGEEPVAGAEVTFDNAEPVATDEDGRFIKLLGRSGRWGLRLRCDEPQVRRQVEREIEAPDDGEPFVLLIQLPDTVVQGEVVSNEGTPVAGASVQVSTLDNPEGLAHTESGDDGWFELRGMPAGTYLVQARATLAGRRLTSQLAEETVREEMTPAPVRLVLDETWTLRGIVQGAGQPMNGVELIAFPIANGQLSQTTLPSARTGVDGMFEMTMPGNAGSVQVVAQATGYPLHVRNVTRQSVEDQGSVVLELGHEHGVLELGAASTNLVIVMVNGHPIHRALLLQWTFDNGVEVNPAGPVSVPLMPPGEYAYCRVTAAEAMLVAGRSALPAASACDTGHLTAGGRLSLQLPDQRSGSATEAR